jgi:hypothetical protein
MDFGLWTLDFGLWTLDFGLWHASPRLPPITTPLIQKNGLGYDPNRHERPTSFHSVLVGPQDLRLLFARSSTAHLPFTTRICPSRSICSPGFNPMHLTHAFRIVPGFRFFQPSRRVTVLVRFRICSVVSANEMFRGTVATQPQPHQAPR